MLDVGHNGAGTAMARYQQSGLVYEQRGRLGLARQGRWVRIDTGAVDEDRKIVHVCLSGQTIKARYTLTIHKRFISESVMDERVGQRSSKLRTCTPVAAMAE
jgi:hypothetical protein